MLVTFTAVNLPLAAWLVAEGMSVGMSLGQALEFSVPYAGMSAGHCLLMSFKRLYLPPQLW